MGYKVEKRYKVTCTGCEFSAKDFHSRASAVNAATDHMYEDTGIEEEEQGNITHEVVVEKYWIVGNEAW